MNPESAIDRLASGGPTEILAVIVGALAIIAIILYRRNNELQDKMLEQANERSRVQSEMISQYHTAIHASAQTVTEAIRRLEALR